MTDTATQELSLGHEMLASETPEPAAEIQSDPANPQLDNAAESTEQPEKDSVEIDEVETEAEGDEPEADADTEAHEEIEATDESAEPTGRYNVTLPDGTTEKVPFKELRDGYLRQADYSRKTSELAAERQSLAAKEEALRQETISRLTALQERISTTQPLPLLHHLLNEAVSIGDEETANRLRFQILDLREKEKSVANALRLEREQEASQKESKTKAETEKFMEGERKALADKLPWVTKPEGQKKFQDVVSKALKHVGKDPKSIKNPTAADAQLAYYAGKYLEMEASKPQVAAALKGKAVMPKPGGRSQESGKAAKLDSALRQFDSNPKGTGSLAALFKATGI